MQAKRVGEGVMEASLSRFLEGGQHLVLGFQKGRDGVNHRIFKEDLEGFALWNPTFNVNGAHYLRRLFGKGMGIILVLRPCEIRAYVELVKLNQIERSNIIAVSVDCFGTVSSKDESDGVPSEPGQIRNYFENPQNMRWPCQVCRERRGVVGDAGIRIDSDGGLWAVSYTERGEEFLALVEGELEEPAIKMLLPEGKKGERFQTDMATLSSDLSKCVLCMNCRNMCPVCYCIDCVFNGDDYLPKGDALLNKVFRTGSVGMPRGKELFHLIRMFHVSQVCVGCGGCEEACPQSVPLTKYFKGVSERLQGVFSYASGEAFDQTIPYLTFLEDELKDAED